MNCERQGFHISHMYSLWQDLSHHTIIFDLVTLKFELISKNVNLGYNIWTMRDGFHISHVYSLWQDRTLNTIIFDLMTLTLKFALLIKNFNLGHKLTLRDTAVIFSYVYVYVLWQDLSHHTIKLTQWPWTLNHIH